MNTRNYVTFTAVKVVVVLKTICDQQRYRTFEEEFRKSMVHRVIFKNRIRNGCVIINKQRPKNRITIHSVRVVEAIPKDNSVDGCTCGTTSIEILKVTNIEAELAVEKCESTDLLNEELQLLLLWVTDARLSDHLRSFLLYGLGSDKASIVKYIAVKCNAWFIPIDLKVILGNTGCNLDRKLKEIIDDAKYRARNSQCMIYIENLNTFCHYTNPLTLAYLETLKDLECAGNIIFCATVDLLSETDENWRKSVFGRQICLQTPNRVQRCQILQHLLSGYKRANDLSLESVADATAGKTEVDLRHLATSAVKNHSQGRDLVAKADFDYALEEVSSHRKKSKKKSLSRNEVGGYDDIKIQLQQATIWPLTSPEIFFRLGEYPPKGILLNGPPGCGKTSLVRSLALSSNINFFSASAAQIYSPYVGDSEKKLVALMQKAKACAPSIVFLDEIDCIIGKRAMSGTESEAGGCGVQERVLSSLLNSLDGIGNRVMDLQRISETFEVEVNGRKICYNENFEDNVLLVAASNEPDMVDKALLRPGRIDRAITVPAPNFEGRISVLRVYTKFQANVNLNLEEIARRTENFTGAELQNLCEQACLRASAENSYSEAEVADRHFTHVLATMKRIRQS